jgi:hypothetical protein
MHVYEGRHSLDCLDKLRESTPESLLRVVLVYSDYIRSRRIPRCRRRLAHPRRHRSMIWCYVANVENYFSMKMLPSGTL